MLELERLRYIADDAERFHEATRLLIELEDTALAIARIRADAKATLGSVMGVPVPDGEAADGRDHVALRWLARHRVGERFTARAAFRGMPRSRFPGMTAMKATLSRLEDAGFIRQVPMEPTGTAGRPPSPVYEVRRQPYLD